MHCIVGLGNPKPRYSLSRHNIGFQIADRLAQSLGCTFQKGKGEYLAARNRIGESDVFIIKPVTYMNRSGVAVQQVAQYYRIPLERIIVVLDDIDLPFGTFRLRYRGGDAGNRGLRSIIEGVGSEEISRFRFGIRNRTTIANPSSYVLSQFTRKEKKELPRLVSFAEEAVVTWVSGGIDRAMNLYNTNHIGR